MKLKAPQGAGDPCVAGVTLTPCDGVYEAEPKIGELLIECFGFVEAEAGSAGRPKAASAVRRRRKSAVTKA